jgi:hypothetical protein
MDNSTTPQSEADQIAAVQEALRMQELDAADREQDFENLREEVALLRKEKQELLAKQPVNLEDATFIIDGEEYQFVYPKLNFGKGEVYTAMEMIERPDILRRLVRNGSASIKLITKN